MTNLKWVGQKVHEIEQEADGEGSSMHRTLMPLSKYHVGRRESGDGSKNNAPRINLEHGGDAKTVETSLSEWLKSSTLTLAKDGVLRASALQLRRSFIAQARDALFRSYIERTSLYGHVTFRTSGREDATRRQLAKLVVKGGLPKNSGLDGLSDFLDVHHDRMVWIAHLGAFGELNSLAAYQELAEAKNTPLLVIGPLSISTNHTVRVLHEQFLRRLSRALAKVKEGEASIQEPKSAKGRRRRVYGRFALGRSAITQTIAERFHDAWLACAQVRLLSPHGDSRVLFPYDLPPLQRAFFDAFCVADVLAGESERRASSLLRSTIENFFAK